MGSSRGAGDLVPRDPGQNFASPQIGFRLTSASFSGERWHEVAKINDLNEIPD